MKAKFQKLYMTIAQTVASMSSARRLQVGAIIVKDDRVISMGYNGMPSGWDNNCEDLVQLSDDTTVLKTKPEVLHAEMNALFKLAKSTESGDQSSMFITHAPCMDCAKGIYQAGIKEVYYGTEYRSTDGIDFLTKCNIKIQKLGG